MPKVLLLLGLLPALMWSQLTVSTLRGTATDQTGAVVAGAEIKVVAAATNFSRSVITNDNGDFEILDLPRDTYRLTATRPGFKTFVRDGVAWKKFTHLYCSIVSECPITFRASKTKLKYVKQVELTGVSEPTFKGIPFVHWRITLQDGSTQSWGFNLW